MQNVQIVLGLILYRDEQCDQMLDQKFQVLKFTRIKICLNSKNIWQNRFNILPNTK